MELVLFLLAGFLSLAEGQSESIDVINGCYLLHDMLISFIWLSFDWLPNTSVKNQNLKSCIHPLSSMQPGPPPL